MAHQEYFSVPEIAQMLGFSRETVQGWIRKGRLPALKVGHSYRIAHQDFATWREAAVFQTKQPDVPALTGPELASLYEDWLLDLRNGAQPCSPATGATHKAHLTKYIRMLLELDPAGRLTYRAVADARSLERVIIRIPATRFASRYNLYSAVRNFTRFLVRRGLAESSTLAAMSRLRPKRLLPARKTVLHSTADLDRLFEAITLAQAGSNYDRILNAALVAVMAYAGLRVSEVADLDLGHVDLGNRLIHVFFAKGGDPRLVGINERLKAKLETYQKVRPAGRETRFFLTRAGTPFDRHLIGRRIKRLSERSGLQVTPHGLRRTFATLNSNAGRSLNLIQLALGHKDIATTQEYLMADNRHAAQQMQAW